MKPLYIFFISLFLIQNSFADEQSFEEIIVTGTRITVDFDDEEVPAIKLIRKADSVLLEVRVANDSRQEELRTEEIRTTLKNMIKLLEKYKNIKLGYGSGIFKPLNMTNYKDLVLYNDSKRNDASYSTIFVKTSLREQKENSKKLINDIKKFISEVPMSGRTELIKDDEPILTLINPEKYRYDLIKLIAEDANKVSNSFGDDYRVMVQGLQQPLHWTRASIDEMNLFIIYRYQVVPKNSSIPSIRE